MKLFAWLGKTLVTAILIAGLSAAATLYVLNAYVQELLKPYAAVLPTNQIKFSDFVAKLWTGSNIVGQGGTQPSGKERTPQPDTSNPVTKPQPEDDAVAAWAQSGKSDAREKDKVVMSAEQFQAKREKLSEEDKASVFSLLISKLPQEELQQISTKLEDGITQAELQEIEKIVEQYLQPDELAKLMEIVNKY
ncbi:hypothetical protein [Paenibacillus sp. GYB003]|uniref:hypothetical protein n=1 Tax=Paenibacillus sp. GYB003 TaxID=2994392 RepID=UPI002F961D7A